MKENLARSHNRFIFSKFSTAQESWGSEVTKIQGKMLILIICFNEEPHRNVTGNNVVSLPTGRQRRDRDRETKRQERQRQIETERYGDNHPRPGCSIFGLCKLSFLLGIRHDPFYTEVNKGSWYAIRQDRTGNSIWQTLTQKLSRVWGIRPHFLALWFALEVKL